MPKSPIDTRPTNDKERQLIEHAYALIGAVATGFSQLEFHLQSLLSLLISGRVASPQGLLVLRKNTFGQKIQLLEDFVSLNFLRDSQMRTRGSALVAALKNDPELNKQKNYSRSADAVIRVYDAAGNVIETHEHKGEFKGHLQVF